MGDFHSSTTDNTAGLKLAIALSMPIDRQTNCILELVSTLVHCWKSTATLKVMNLIKIGLPATLRWWVLINIHIVHKLIIYSVLLFVITGKQRI